MRSVARVLIAGCGYVGTALGERLVEDSHVVWGLRRRATYLPPRLRAIEADLALPRTLEELPRDLDYIFYTASAGGPEEPLYRRAYSEGLCNLLEALQSRGQRPRRLFFTSSTAVFAQEGGSWVDEGSVTESEHFAGRLLIEAEQSLRDGPFASTVLRLSGIYGPRRTRLLDQVRAGRARYRDDPPHYTNRIHVDDCAGALRHLMNLPEPAGLYLGVDDEPATERAVMEWLAGVSGAPAPKAVSRAEPRKRAGRGNKRCRNARLRASGYEFQYRTFREGYRAVIDARS